MNLALEYINYKKIVSLSSFCSMNMRICTCAVSQIKVVPRQLAIYRFPFPISHFKISQLPIDICINVCKIFQNECEF